MNRIYLKFYLKFFEFFKKYRSRTKVSCRANTPPPLSGLCYGKLNFYFFLFFPPKVFKAILAEKITKRN